MPYCIGLWEIVRALLIGSAVCLPVGDITTDGCLNECLVERYCGSKHAHGNGTKRFQRLTTCTRSTVTTADEHRFQVDYLSSRRSLAWQRVQTSPSGLLRTSEMMITEIGVRTGAISSGRRYRRTERRLRCLPSRGGRVRRRSRRRCGDRRAGSGRGPEPVPEPQFHP